MSQWIKCSEQMPEEGAEVLVWGGDSGEEAYPLIGNWDSRYWYGIDTNLTSFKKIFNVTHWQSLPPPPEEA